MFYSSSTNLVPDDTNNTLDVFVHDRQTKATSRVSLNSNGVQGNDASATEVYGNGLSADGRYVLFWSEANNLYAGDINQIADIFVHDRLTKQTMAVNIDSEGNDLGQLGVGQGISADGRFVAFTSLSYNGFQTSASKIYIYDINSRKATNIYLTSNGLPANGYVDNLVFSSDGRYIAFSSNSTDLVAEVSDDKKHHLYVHDLLTNQTMLGSTSAIHNGTLLRELISINTMRLRFSANGRYFIRDTNVSLIPNDTNGLRDIYVTDIFLNKASFADISIKATLKPTSLALNQVGDYSYTIKNNGPNTVAGLNLTHIVSQGSIVSLTSSSGNCTPNTISLCKLDKLSAGKSIILQATIKATGNPLSQRISINANSVDLAPANNSIQVQTTVAP